MANKVYNMEGGLHSAAAYSAFENSMWGSCVASSSDFVATAGTGMNISLSAGNGMIDTGLGFSRRIASDAVNTISVDAASSANPRKDALVAYIDNGVTPTTSVLDNTNDILKFACVAGSPAATPAAPSDATIQTAIGAGNPYVVLWYVTVPKSATSLSTATFTDNRNISSKIDGSNIKDGTVTSSKIDLTTSTIPCTIRVNGVESSSTLRKIDLGGGRVLLMGSYNPYVQSITADSLADIRVITSSALLRTIWSYSITAAQAQSTTSQLCYSYAIAQSTNLITACVRTTTSASSFVLSFIIFGEE